MNDITPETPEARMSVSPEFAQKHAEAKARISQEMDKPGSAVANPTEQMGLLASIGGLYKDMVVKKMGILFKDAKATLSILPFVPLASEALKVAKGGAKLDTIAHVNKAIMAEGQVARAQKAVNKAERWAGWFKKSEKAQQKLATAAGELAKAQKESQAAVKIARGTLETRKAQGAANAIRNEGMVSKFVRKKLVHNINEADYVLNYEKAVNSAKGLTDAEKIMTAASGDLPAKTFAERVAKRSGKVGKHLLWHNLGPIIDPAPDVPGVVVLGSLGAELFGQVWAGLIPAAWQMVHNRYETAKVDWETAMKAKDIIKSHFEKKMSKLKQPDVAKAAEAFVPTPSKAAV